MGEGKLLRPEGYITAILQKTVLSVSHKGQPVVGKLASDLMSAAGDKLYPHKTETFFSAQTAVVQSGLLYAFGGSVGNIAFSLSLVAVHQVFKAALIGCFAMNHRQIALTEVSFPYLPGKLRRRIGTAPQHHKPAYHTVKPVDCTHIGTLIPQLLSHKLRQTTGLVGGKYSRWLYAHYDFVVNILYLHIFQLLKTPRHSAGVSIT